LNPKKLKPLLTELCSEHENNLVNDVLDYYWMHVRKSIISVAYPRINVENLGIFQIRIKNLDKLISVYKSKLDYLDKNNFAKYTKYHNMSQRLEVLEKAKSEYIAERDRKIELKTNRYGRTNTNMEEEGKDS
jgi:hypothetical protein